jgi:hypothetical protein
VVHAYNPSIWKDEAEDYKFEASLSYIVSLDQPELHSMSLSQKTKYL